MSRSYIKKPFYNVYGSTTSKPRKLKTNRTIRHISKQLLNNNNTYDDYAEYISDINFPNKHTVAQVWDEMDYRKYYFGDPILKSFGRPAEHIYRNYNPWDETQKLYNICFKFAPMLRDRYILGIEYELDIYCKRFRK